MTNAQKGGVPENPQPGRYISLCNGGGFLAKCANCAIEVEHDWGNSGPAGASQALRRAGWSVVGRTSAAKWRCTFCTIAARQEQNQ